MQTLVMLFIQAFEKSVKVVLCNHRYIASVTRLEASVIDVASLLHTALL